MTYMNIVHSRANLISVLLLFKCLQQLKIRTTILNGYNVGVHSLNSIHDVVEIRVTHVSVNLVNHFRYQVLIIAKEQTWVESSTPVVANKNASTAHSKYASQSERLNGKPSRIAGSSI
jgi:hypothetical protein